MIPDTLDAFHGDNITSFSELASAGIKRIIHKATEGVTEVDPAYASRMPEAIAAGLQWEAYHFWRPDDPAAQADNFVKVASSAATFWLDYEVAGGTPTNIVAVMQAMSDGTGEPTGLYTTRSLADALVHDATGDQMDFLEKCPLWLAEPGVKKPFLTTFTAEVWPKISLWQYTWNGRIAGVKGKCDLNCIPA